MCRACRYPASTCICNAIIPHRAPLDILIIQDDTERRHPKNTAKIVTLMLTNAQMVAAQDTTHWLPRLDAHCALLYPASHAAVRVAPPTPIHSPRPAEWAEKPELHSTRVCELDTIKTLVVLDGTWRKTKKVYLTHTALQRLPHWQLSHLPASTYHRHTSRSQSVSTLEAIAYSLMCAHGYSPDALLNAQHALTQHWMHYLGSH